MGKRRIADEREIMAMYTAVMRGEITDWAVRKTGGAEELMPVPPKVSDRMHAAELLGKRILPQEERRDGDAEAAEVAEVAEVAEEIARMLRSLEAPL